MSAATMQAIAIFVFVGFFAAMVLTLGFAIFITIKSIITKDRE